VSEYTAERIERNIENAVTFAATCHDAYSKADHVVRRGMNQAFFNRILITEDGITKWEYNAPFAVLMAAHGISQPIVNDVSEATISHHVEAVQNSRRAYRTTHNRKDPNLLARVFSEASSKERLWRREGDSNPRNP